MSTNDPYQQRFGSAGGGWICAQCGQWIPAGTLHNCQAGQQAAQYINAAPVYPYTIELLLQQILETLKAIQGDLETLGSGDFERERQI